MHLDLDCWCVAAGWGELALMVQQTAQGREELTVLFKLVIGEFLAGGCLNQARGLIFLLKKPPT